jgi:hypothetical protein
MNHKKFEEKFQKDSEKIEGSKYSLTPIFDYIKKVFKKVFKKTK